MSKDLRFNKKDCLFSDDADSTELEMDSKGPKHIQADAKYRSRENHLRRSRKRSLEVENDA